MNGYCPAFLSHIEALAGCNPAKKLAPLGMLKAVLSTMDASTTATVNQPYNGGHIGSMTVSYQERPSVDGVSDVEDDCSDAALPAKKEFNMPGLLHRRATFWMPDSLVRQYCIDASDPVNIRKNDAGALQMENETAVMREVYENLVIYGGTVLHAINRDLVTAQLTQFGVNVKTGTNAAVPLAFNLSSNGMSDAFVQLMAQIRENEFCEDELNALTFVGNGDFANLDLIKKWFANAAADSGLNKANMLASFPNVFYDKDTTGIWGANQIGVFEKGSLALISFDKYVGQFARKLANTEMFTMPLPVQEYCCPQEYLDRLNFDIKIREIDCPTQMTVNGVNTTVSEGVAVTISKNFNLFTRPDTLYPDGDPLEGTNGTLRFEIAATD